MTARQLLNRFKLAIRREARRQALSPIRISPIQAAEHYCEAVDLEFGIWHQQTAQSKRAEKGWKKRKAVAK